MNETLVVVERSSVEIDYFLDFLVPLTPIPALDVLLFTFIMIVLMIFLHRYFRDQEEIDRLGKDIRYLEKKKFKIENEDLEKADLIQNKINSKTRDYIKENTKFKVAVPTILPLFLILIHLDLGYSYFGVVLDFGFAQLSWLGSFFLFFVFFYVSIFIKELFYTKY